MSTDWGVIASWVVIATPCAGFLGWASKSGIDARIRKHQFVSTKAVEEIKANTAQLRRNGGSHVADSIARIEQAVAELRAEHQRGMETLGSKVDGVQSKVDRLEGRYDEHVRQSREG